MTVPGLERKSGLVVHVDAVTQLNLFDLGLLPKRRWTSRPATMSGAALTRAWPGRLPSSLRILVVRLEFRSWLRK